MTFTISPAIKQCWPETALGLLLYQVQVAPSSPQLLAQFDQTVASPTRPWGPPTTNTGSRRRRFSGGW